LPTLHPAYLYVQAACLCIFNIPGSLFVIQTNQPKFAKQEIIQFNFKQCDDVTLTNSTSHSSILSFHCIGTMSTQENGPLAVGQAIMHKSPMAAAWNLY